MNRDLIVFGEDWGGLPSSTQHLIRHLSKYRKVIWINSIGLRQPRLTMHDIKRALHKITRKKILPRSEDIASIPSNFTVVNPSTFPAPRSILCRELASEWLKRQLIPIIDRVKLYQPIIWTSLPTAIDVANKIESSSLVYYCCDDFSSLAGVDHVTVTHRERELVNKADLILTSSETLYRRFPSNRTKLLPHGVDYSLFSTPAPRALDLPNNGRPIAGFYGSLSEWLDYDLLEATISARPDWDFVFIGRGCTKAMSLQRHTNVTLLGPRAHQHLPRYSQHWTACLLPFTDNAQIQACNPLKLREYLATGKPVISTPFPALTEYQEFVSVVTTHTEMSFALDFAAEKHLNVRQQQAVKPHTWEARAQQLEKWLDTL